MQITQQEQYVEADRLDTIIRSKARVFCLVLFFIAIIASYLQWCLHDYRSFKLEDSGLFLHVGQRLLHGDALYRDIADNKPPLVYWLNAFGLLLGHGSPGGVFALCLVSGLLMFAVMYWGLKQYVGWQLFIVAGCWSQLGFLVCALHPNYTESFCLPLVAIAAVLFIRELMDAEKAVWLPLAQGAVAALLFCLRPNNSGIAIIYFLYLVLELRKGGRFRQVGLFLLGGAAAYGLILIPLAVQGILPDYLTNVFRLAGPYTAGTTQLARLRALWHGFSIFGSSPLLYFSVACGVTVILSDRQIREARALFWLAAWLVLEMVLSSTSGYHWDHYYLLWILPMAFILMIAGSVLFARGLNPILPVVLALSLVLVLFNEALINANRAWSYPRPEDPALALASTYVQKGDRVTTWGCFDHDLWFDLNHQAGTRWFHEGAFTNRMIYRALVPTFLSDLDRNRPRVVVERRSVVPLFAPANPKEPLNIAFPAEYFVGWDDPSILKRKAALTQLYRPVIEKSGVVVYLRRE